MQISTLSDTFSTTGQLNPEDLVLAAAAGFRSILCNRPDGEGGAEQPSSQALSSTAGRLGLIFVYLPVSSVDFGEAEVRAFNTLLDRLPKPVLAFCRTGKRSTRLYERHRANDVLRTPDRD